jgi:hypothetical protein
MNLSGIQAHFLLYHVMICRKWDHSIGNPWALDTASMAFPFLEYGRALSKGRQPRCSPPPHTRTVAHTDEPDAEVNVDVNARTVKLTHGCLQKSFWSDNPRIFKARQK